MKTFIVEVIERRDLDKVKNQLNGKMVNENLNLLIIKSENEYALDDELFDICEESYSYVERNY